MKTPEALLNRRRDAELKPTDIGLLVRLRNADDYAAWQEFIRLYEKLIYRAAIKAGLTEDEAEEVLQQTMISVARRMESFCYKPERRSFKGWLMHVTRGHTNDCRRKRRTRARRFESWQTATSGSAEEFPDTHAERAFEAMWDEEWQTGVLCEADICVKRSVKAGHYEIYHLHCVDCLPVREVSKRLSVLAVTVRVVSFRVARRMRHEVQRLERKQL